MALHTGAHDQLSVDAVYQDVPVGASEIISERNAIDRAKAHEANTQYDMAVIEYNNAIASVQKPVASLLERGNLWLVKGNCAEALADYTVLVRLEPKQARFLAARANSRLVLREYNKALDDYAEAVRLAPHEDWIYHMRAEVWMKTGAYDKALEDYNEAVRLNPENGEALGRRAWLFATCPDEKYRKCESRL
jgi:tetratricopeptide (TPR) repeat protein